MNSEELELYKKLQSVIKEKMGKLLWSDWIWCPKCQEVKVHCIHLEECCNEEIDNLLRLPLPIDPVNPERGLWGMVDGLHQVDQDVAGKWWVHCISTEGMKYSRVCADTPTLALLKALEAQKNL